MKTYVESLWEPEVAIIAIAKFQRIFNSYKGARNSGRIRRFEDVISGASSGYGTSSNRYTTLIDDYVDEIAKEELPQWIIDSYLDANYRTVRNNAEIELFRDFGNDAFANGSFATTIPNASRNDLALHPSFNNSMRFKATIKVPPGRSLNIGKVGPYPPGSPDALSGGADQILVEMDYPLSWITNIFDTQTGINYSISEFQNHFPQLIR